MTKFQIARIAAAAVWVALSCSGAYAAGNTASIAVSANIAGVCQATAGGSLVFTLDATLSSDATAVATQPSFWCTKGTAWALGDDTGLWASGGSKRMKGPGAADFVKYSMSYTTSGTGGGKSTPIGVSLAGTVVNADYINATAGAYADTVTLTITP